MEVESRDEMAKKGFVGGWENGQMGMEMPCNLSSKPRLRLLAMT